jgi:hypothetical protein
LRLNAKLRIQSLYNKDRKNVCCSFALISSVQNKNLQDTLTSKEKGNDKYKYKPATFVYPVYAKYRIMTKMFIIIAYYIELVKEYKCIKFNDCWSYVWFKSRFYSCLNVVLQMNLRCTCITSLYIWNILLCCLIIC